MTFVFHVFRHEAHCREHIKKTVMHMDKRFIDFIFIKENFYAVKNIYAMVIKQRLKTFKILEGQIKTLRNMTFHI